MGLALLKTVPGLLLLFFLSIFIYLACSFKKELLGSQPKAHRAVAFPVIGPLLGQCSVALPSPGVHLNGEDAY